MKSICAVSIGSGAICGRSVFNQCVTAPLQNKDTKSILSYAWQRFEGKNIPGLKSRYNGAQHYLITCSIT